MNIKRALAYNRPQTSLWRGQSILVGLLFALSVAAIWFGLPDLPRQGKMALFLFLAAIGAWTMSQLDATLVAVCASLAMWGAGLLGGAKVLSGLGDPFISFVIAGFMLGGAYKVSGLSEQLAHWFARHSRSVGQLFYLLTTALVLLSFVVPSTSARAALLMPVYVVVASACQTAPVRKALAVLFPTIIVLSCVTSYLGAGANLMTADFIARFSGERLTYWQWLVLGGPFGTVSCYASTWVILTLFLNKAERAMPFRFARPNSEKTDSEKTSNKKAQRKVLAITVVLIAVWMSEQWHSIDAGMAALGGALLLCLPKTGVFSFKQALKEVEWSLVVFMAATIDLSRGLVGSGLVDYAMRHFSVAASTWSGHVVLCLILVLALLSHLLIHSRTARAAVLLPILIPLGMAAGHSGLLVAFFANAAMGYCLTLPVCAKPVAMFSTVGGEGYTAQDLLRLSAWLLPLHLLLLWVAWWVYE